MEGILLEEGSHTVRDPEGGREREMRVFLEGYYERSGGRMKKNIELNDFEKRQCFIWMVVDLKFLARSS